MAEEIVLLEGVRTPYGKFGGSLRAVGANDLGAVAAKGAMKRAGVEPKDVQHVVFGNVMQTGGESIYCARHVGLKAGIPIETPALTLNRLCGSGLQAIITAAQMILLGEADVVLAGGTENMSQTPHIVRNARWGMDLGRPPKLEDLLWEGLLDTYSGDSMGMTAENLAKKYSISREETDTFALRSQQAAKAAIDAGRLAEEIVPVEVTVRGRTVLVDKDEHPRPETTMESLAKLSPSFSKEGVVTAGNASGIVDGAAAVVVTTAKVARERGYKVLGRLVSWGYAGVEPKFMGIGPVPSSKNALARAGLKLDQIDLIEVNEAFSPQYIACEKELGLDRNKVNVNGGAVALGHPLGSTGTRTTLTVLYELRRRKQKLGLSTMCIGGGQGIAGIVELA